MGIIERIILNYRLAKFANVFAEVISATKQEFPEDAEGGGFTYLSQTRQAQIRFHLPKWIATLRKYPPHIITQEMIKASSAQRLAGNSIQSFAYTNLFHYLQTKGIAIDLDSYIEHYAV